MKFLRSGICGKLIGSKGLGAVIDEVDDDGLRNAELGFLIDFNFLLRFALCHQQF